MAAKKTSDDKADEAEAPEEEMVPSGYPYDPNLAKQQQEAYFLQQYIDLSIRSENIIGMEETATRVRAGLDRLKAMADSMAEG